MVSPEPLSLEPYKLHNLTEALELCDETGRVLAHLTHAIRPSL